MPELSDLRRFHELCGGAVLFEGALFGWRIVGPDRLVPANPRLLGEELAREVATDYADDVTNGCFVFAETLPDGTGPVVVVDLHPTRAGRFYDASWDSYGLVGQMPVLALSVSEMIRRLLDTLGKRDVHEGQAHGDAYDKAG